MLESPLQIAINGPEVCKEECDQLIWESARRWLSQKKRNKRTPGDVLVSTCKITFVSSGTQSDPEGVVDLQVNKTVLLKTFSIWCLLSLICVASSLEFWGTSLPHLNNSTIVFTLKVDEIA